MGTLQDVHKESPFGRKSQWLSMNYVYRVGLAIYIEMVGPVSRCCHFACLGSLSSLTLHPLAPLQESMMKTLVISP